MLFFSHCRGKASVRRFLCGLQYAVAVGVLVWAPCLIAAGATGRQDKAEKRDVAATTNKETAPAAQHSVLTLKRQVNLVLVPVVVWNRKGKAVGTLTRDDFRIFDNGKSQPLSSFSLETNPPTRERDASGGLAAGPAETAGAKRPTHFFAYLFDDIHFRPGNLMVVRQAAKKHIARDMGPDDRAAVYTTSGDVDQEFTGSRAKLDRAVDSVKPEFTEGRDKCPYMDYYLAEQIIDESASDLTPIWDAATNDAWNCRFHKAPYLQPEARRMALDAARREIEVGDSDARRSLLAIQQVVRRLASMPGSRTLILVSPGFQPGDDYLEQDVAIDLATKQNVVINALDGRGLYTGMRQTDNNGPSTLTAEQKEDPYERQALLLRSSVMANLTDGTGGKLFRDSNDLAGGFDEIGSPPEFVYMLGFEPQNLKESSRYHHLKVVVANKRHGWMVQARPGYFATKAVGAPAEQLTAELREALFSRNEVRTIPVTVKEKASKQGAGGRKLSVITHIDLSGVHFREKNHKNIDKLILVCGLFDINGNYLQGKRKDLSLHLTGDVLRQMVAGMNIETSFDVKPGAYLIRVVVRDSGDGLLSTVNGSDFIE